MEAVTTLTRTAQEFRVQVSVLDVPVDVVICIDDGEHPGHPPVALSISQDRLHREPWPASAGLFRFILKKQASGRPV
jgi:hypothetical protein